MSASPGEASGRPGGDQAKNGEWPTARGLSSEGRPRAISAAAKHTPGSCSWEAGTGGSRRGSPGHLGSVESEQAGCRPPSLG